MADILRIKRRVSGAPGAPGTLQNAELAYSEVDHTLYYGEGTGGAGGSATVVVPIGGQGLASSSNPVMDSVANPGSASQWARGDHVHSSDTSRAPINSPTFTGTPSAPTAPNGTNTNQLATTANVLATRLDQLAPPGANVSINNKLLTNVLDPVSGQDAATKSYVDNSIQGLDTKDNVIVATTANITLSGTQTIDGIALAVGDRVLVKDQTTTAGNGIYICQSAAWIRATDMNTWLEVPGAFTFVSQGTTNADTGWVCTSDPGGTINTTAILWAQFSSAGQVTAGTGLQKVGNQLNVIGTANRISVGAAVDIASNYIGQASISTVGSISNGIWQGSQVGVPYGGTGAITLTGYVKGNGTIPMTASPTIPNADVAGLGSMALQFATAVAITGGTIDNVTLDGGIF